MKCEKSTTVVKFKIITQFNFAVKIIALLVTHCEITGILLSCHIGNEKAIIARFLMVATNVKPALKQNVMPMCVLTDTHTG
jgi:hypothetical protein